MSDTHPPQPMPPTHENAATRSRHWSDWLLSAAALLISAVSLWVAFDTQKSNRALVAEAAWPFVQVFTSGGNDTPRVLTLNMSNAGIGPAKIKSFEVFWNGHAYASTAALMKDCCGLTQADGMLGTSSVAGTVLRPGDSVPLIRFVQSDANEASWSAFRAQRFKLTHRICFCSVLDECWLTRPQALADTQDLEPPKVDACPVPAVSFAD